MKKGGGALAFPLKEGIRGAGFSIVSEKDLRACHLASEHSGFGFDFTFWGKEKPISLRHTFSDGAFGCFLALFIEVDSATVSLVGLTKLASVDRFVGAVEDKFDFAGFRFSGAQDNLALDISVRAGAKDLGGNERGFVVVPDRIASGLIGGIRKLVGLVYRTPNGFCGLQALKDGIDDKTHFGLATGTRSSQGEA
jgi:hypothetical protein